MPVNTWGYIFTRCTVCGHQNRVLVTFPAYNKPFISRTYECSKCGVHHMVSDPHKYDNDGNVIK